MRKVVTLLLAVVEILLIYDCLKTEMELTTIVLGIAAGLLVFIVKKHLIDVWKRKVMRFLIVFSS